MKPEVRVDQNLQAVLALAAVYVLLKLLLLATRQRGPAVQRLRHDFHFLLGRVTRFWGCEAG